MKKEQALRIFLIVVAALCGSFVSVPDVRSYPERDIVCIVPAPPGGGTDVVARAAAPYLKKYLPKNPNIIVQNIAAVGGRTAWINLYDAKPDGYTIGSMEYNVPAVAKTIGQFGDRDPMRMTFFQRVSHSPYMLGFGAKSPIKVLEDLKGKKVLAACSQVTILPSMGGLRVLGAQPQPVFYGGGSDCALAAMRGDVDVVAQPGGTLVRMVASSGGKLIPILSFSEERLWFAKDIPTVKEKGFHISEGLMAALDIQYFFAAPAGLPADVARILNEAIQKMIGDPEFSTDLERVKLDLAVLPPDKVEKGMSMMLDIAAQYKDILVQSSGK
jgi:tripartite-type tricarboxylate transporter receptor subunit TctC